jgi:hypothetical protein
LLKRDSAAKILSATSHLINMVDAANVRGQIVQQIYLRLLKRDSAEKIPSATSHLINMVDAANVSVRDSRFLILYSSHQSNTLTQGTSS